MASVSFSGVFVAPATDLSDFTYLDSALSVQGDTSKRGDFRMYAGGRVRLITRPGSLQSVEVSTEYVDQTVHDELRALVGQVILYRDGRGRKFFGAFLNLQATEVRGGQKYVNLSFSVNEVTHSEAV